MVVAVGVEMCPPWWLRAISTLTVFLVLLTGVREERNCAFTIEEGSCPRPVTNCSRVKIISLLIYKILNYDRFDKTNMTIDHTFPHKVQVLLEDCLD